MYPTYEYESNGRPSGENPQHPLFKPAFERIVRDIEPVEMCGEAGDVVWCESSLKLVGCSI